MPDPGIGGRSGSSGKRAPSDADNQAQALAKSFRYFQETVRRSGPAAVAGYTLIGSIILLGGLGYAIDAWQGTAPWFLFGGLMLGIVVGFYELAKTVWRR
jgi:F0F1-type ATP synthase assembly protein I